MKALHLTLIVILLLICGCSGGSSPIEPPIDGDSSPAGTPTDNNRHIWGIWEIEIDADRQSAVVNPLRSAEMHLNLTYFLETACSDCLWIGNFQVYSPTDFSCDIRLKHPFPDILEYTGFDVRGIMITGSDYTFPECGRKIAWGPNLPRFMNPSGYTPLFNPTEFPEDGPGPPVLKYFEGKFAESGDLSATLNPFVSYGRYGPRRMFPAGDVETRRVRINAPTGPIEFGYAVDGCWTEVANVVDPVVDFPPDANCHEAYRIDVDIESWPAEGESSPIAVTVFDHQGPVTIESVSIESPGMFSGEITLTPESSTEKSAIFTCMLPNDLGVDKGEVPLLLRVADAASDENLGQIDAWHVYKGDIIGELQVGEIEGPGTLDEYAVRDYFIDASGDTGITYEWSIIPSTGGIFTDPDSAIASLRLAGVVSDSSVQVKVAVSSDNHAEIIRTLTINVLETIATAENAHEVDFLPGSVTEKTDNSLTFTYDGDPPDFLVGDILAGSELDGYLCKVESIQDFGTYLEIQTTQATLEELILDGDIAAMIHFGQHHGDAVRTGQIERTACGDIYLPFNALDIDLTGTVLYENVIDANNYFRLTIPSGRITFTPAVYIRMDFEWFIFLTYMETYAEGNLKLDLDLLAEAEGNYTLPNLDDITLGYVAVPLWIGPVYTTIEFEVTAGVILNANGAGQATGGVDVRYNPKLGFLWGKDIGYEMINNLLDAPTIIPDEFQGTAELHVDAQAYVRPDLTLKFFGVVGPGINIEPYLDFVADGNVSTEPPYYCFTYDLDACLDSHVYVIGEIFGITLFDWQADLLDPDLRWDIIDGDFPEGCTSGPEGSGWARTWGGTSYDMGYAVAVDSSGNAWVTGDFSDTVDFDPGSGVENYTSNGLRDIFLSKFDSSGDFLWARTWGGATDGDLGLGVAVDPEGNAWVTGYFRETVDFDPGPGVENHNSNGSNDIFLSKFGPFGDFLWARTWGGTSPDDSRGVTVDSLGNAWVTGHFWDTVDFDPGSGVENYTSNGLRDIFLSKFDSSGNFLWARTWGGIGFDAGCGVAVDSSGNAWITGFFCDTVDFDPGSGVENHTSNGSSDIFLSKFDSSGNFLWAHTWGSAQLDMGYEVTVDSSGNAWVTGYFMETVDFDPGSGVENHMSYGDLDIFLSKFDSPGNFLWARTWGGATWDAGHGVGVDSSGNASVTGLFTGVVDFDPSSGVENHTSYGDLDIFLSRFDSSGSFLWARTWGAVNREWGTGVSVDLSGNSWVTGWFNLTVDIAPTDPPCNEDPDEHTSNGSGDAFLVKYLPDGCW